MAEAATVRRVHPLEGRRAIGPGVLVTPMPPAAKLSVRLRPDGLAAAGRAFGLALPTEPSTSTRNGGRSALWLGPDEWLVVDEDGPFDDALAALEPPFSAVDVSHRNTSVEVAGAGAELVLASGCPLDLSIGAFPAGKCTRTVLGKAEIVLWRQEAEIFRVDCWRSFGDYVFDFLAEAAADAGF